MIQFLTEFIICMVCLYFLGVTSKGLHKITANLLKGSIPSLSSFQNTLSEFIKSYGAIMAPTPQPKKVSSLILFIFAPYVCLFQLVFVLMFMPIGYDFACAQDNTSILWIFFLIVFGHLLTLIIAYTSNLLPVLSKMPQFLVNFCGSLLMLYLILETIILWSGSINLSWIVDDQKRLWHMVPLFPLFVVYLIFILHFCHKKPFGSLKGNVFPIETYRAPYKGGLDWLLQITEEISYIVLCGLGVILFAGGGAPLFKEVELHPLSWMAIKTILMVVTLSGVSSRLPNFTHGQVLDLMLKIILPGSIFLFFVYLSIKTLIL